MRAVGDVVLDLDVADEVQFAIHIRMEQVSDVATFHVSPPHLDMVPIASGVASGRARAAT